MTEAHVADKTTGVGDTAGEGANVVPAAVADKAAVIQEEIAEGMVEPEPVDADAAALSILPTLLAIEERQRTAILGLAEVGVALAVHQAEMAEDLAGLRNGMAADAVEMLERLDCAVQSLAANQMNVMERQTELENHVARSTAALEDLLRAVRGSAGLLGACDLPNAYTVDPEVPPSPTVRE